MENETEEHWCYNCPNTQSVCKYTIEILNKIYPDKTFENTKRFFLVGFENDDYEIDEICLETFYDTIYSQRNPLYTIKAPHNQPNTNKLTKSLQPISDQKNVYRKNDNEKRNRKTANTTSFKNMYAEKHPTDKDTTENTHNRKYTLT